MRLLTLLGLHFRRLQLLLQLALACLRLGQQLLLLRRLLGEELLTLRALRALRRDPLQLGAKARGLLLQAARLLQLLEPYEQRRLLAAERRRCGFRSRTGLG
ncbi:hypothetical protein, partial [Paenibacillus barengoltzii]